VPMMAPVPAELEPTASQVFADGQAMPRRYEATLGRLWVFQVVPPLFVPITTPPVELEPTASQVVADAQAIPDRYEISAGSLWVFQVVAPLVMPMTTALFVDRS